MSLASADERKLFLARIQLDFEYFARHCLKIRVILPDGQEPWIPFVLNPEQRTVLRWIEDCERRKVAVRVMILKARKLGMSTLAEAYMFWKCCFRKAFRAITVAHLQEAANEIAAIVLGFNENLPEPLRPYAGRDKQGGLVWENKSRVRVLTARSDDVARGGSPSFLLLSEVSAYDKNRAKTSAEDFLSAALGSMDEVAGTYVVQETTARGANGAFYERWQLEKDAGDRAMWQRFFFDWQSSDKYAPGGYGGVDTIRVDDQALHDELVRAYGENRIADARAAALVLGYTEPRSGHVSETWLRRAVEHNLLPAQVRWAMRLQYGKWRGDLVRFDREFPVSPQVAFTAGGRTVFPSDLLNVWRERRRPEQVLLGGSIEPTSDGFRLDAAGTGWELYELPEPGHEYVIGGDPSGGRGSDDSADGEKNSGCYAALYLHDRHSRRQVGQFYSKTTASHELAVQAVRAARWYHNAFIACEDNNHGQEFHSRCLDMGYTRLYRKNPGTPVRAGTSFRKSLGVNTNPGNRTALIDALVAACTAPVSDPRRFEPIAPAFFREADSFVYDATDYPDHQPGEYSDAIFAAAMAVEGDRQLPAVRVVAPAAPPKDALLSVLSEVREDARRRWARHNPGGVHRRGPSPNFWGRP